MAASRGNGPYDHDGAVVMVGHVVGHAAERLDGVGGARGTVGGQKYLHTDSFGG
jgi:hypothetical protein